MVKTVKSYWVKLYIAGNIDDAKRFMRRECVEEGLCVTVDPTHYIYTNGDEYGIVIGFLNYPRFPKAEDVIYRRAVAIGTKLLAELCQSSFLIMDPKETAWFTTRKEDSFVKSK